MLLHQQCGAECLLLDFTAPWMYIYPYNNYCTWLLFIIIIKKFEEKVHVFFVK